MTIIFSIVTVWSVIMSMTNVALGIRAILDVMIDFSVALPSCAVVSLLFESNAIYEH